MPRQDVPKDLHSKRVATDADHWISWLERLAEIRRASVGEEARQVEQTMAIVSAVSSLTAPSNPAGPIP
jgi:hypothetical protein